MLLKPFQFFWSSYNDAMSFLLYDSYGVYAIFISYLKYENLKKRHSVSIFIRHFLIVLIRDTDGTSNITRSVSCFVEKKRVLNALHTFFFWIFSRIIFIEFVSVVILTCTQSNWVWNLINTYENRRKINFRLVHIEGVW